MTIDLTTLPTSIDAIHLSLAALIIVLLIVLIAKARKFDPISEAEAPSTAPIESDTVSALKESSPESALQLLSLLQHEARFIDFIKEDLQAFSDADIGAAARIVHEGSQKTLNNYFTLAPVRSEQEDTQITLNEGFNASEVRLTGNVMGQAPFTGTLIHRGWQVTEVKLPKLASGHNVAIVAAAEVEL